MRGLIKYYNAIVTEQHQVIRADATADTTGPTGQLGQCHWADATEPTVTVLTGDPRASQISRVEHPSVRPQTTPVYFRVKTTLSDVIGGPPLRQTRISSRSSKFILSRVLPRLNYSLQVSHFVNFRSRHTSPKR